MGEKIAAYCLELGLKNAESLRMPLASLASLACLAACRASAAFCLAASLGSMRTFFSEGCSRGPGMGWGDGIQRWAGAWRGGDIQRWSGVQLRPG